MSEDQEEQENELLVLATIYDGEEFRRSESTQGGEIQLCLELPKDFKIYLKEGNQTEYAVSYLPPLVLNFELPPDYPSTSEPIFTLSSKWLSRAQLTAVCQRLDELWEGCRETVVLFSWIQFLREDILSFLCIESPLEIASPGARRESDEEKNGKAPPDPRAVVDVDPRADILSLLLDFDEAQRQRAFNSSVYSCGICFAEKLGSLCLRFKECSHVYCMACLSEYFQIQIRDGNVRCLNCPELECSSVATPSQVKLLVGEELFARYDRLLLQSSLDLMADVVYCPRKTCQSAVIVEPNASMGICPSCQFAFCVLCKRTYHGVSMCQLTAEDLKCMREKYLSASDEEKKFFEQRYGKQVILRSIEESYSREWMDQNCKECPRCCAKIQKVDGCNKMTCTFCKQYFCWLCLNLLTRGNPYQHFNDSSLPCYNRLFQGEDDGFSDEDD